MERNFEVEMVFYYMSKVGYIVSEINQHEVSNIQIKMVAAAGGFVFFNRQDRLFLILPVWQFEIGSVV